MQYGWSRRTGPLDPQIVGEELERIRSRSGKLLPHEVVKESKPKRAPLHKAFEWDDAIAGNKYRVFQARNLIRSVRVVREEKSSPAFVHIPKPDGPYYQSTDVAVQNVDEFALAVEALAKKLSGAQTALDDLRAAGEGRGADVCALLGIAAQALVTARETIAKVN